MSIKVCRPDSKITSKWDAFVDSAVGGTMFHRQDFLSYHGQKFIGSVFDLAWCKGEQLVAVMPAAILEVNGRKILKSPYGASFGGVAVSDKVTKLKEMLTIIDELIGFCESESIDEVFITIAPQVYYTKNRDALLFALEGSGFNLVSRDVFSIVDISDGYEKAWSAYEGRSRTAVRKSTKQFNFQRNAPIADFFPVLVEDKSRLDARPTHSLFELQNLQTTFPDRIWTDMVTHTGTGAKAGICYFAVTRDVVMTFYMSQETTAMRQNGINVLVDQGIRYACDQGFRYFDFGSSTIGYTVQNIGVANFKESFGAESSSRLTYAWRRK
jgi:hypothetical protein